MVAATNQNLEQAVREGRFREDLFHRLNVIRVRTPSLRERKEDVPLLLQHFLRRSAAELETETKILLPETMSQLQGYDWPGNVRQLENFCRWITVMAPGQQVHIEDLPEEIFGGANEPKPMPATPANVASVELSSSVGSEDWEAAMLQWAATKWEAGDSDLIPAAIERVEQRLAQFALERCENHRQEAARRLGWGRNTLTRKLKDFGWS